MVVFRSLAFAERTNPDVIRLTANTCKSALPVAIPCDDALFVLVLRFMNFSSGVPSQSGSNPKREKSFQRMPTATLCRSALADSGAPQSLWGTDIKPTSQGFSIRTLTYMTSAKAMSDRLVICDWSARA